MKKAIVTTRAVESEDVSETRDCIDRCLVAYLSGLDIMAYPMPNFINPDLVGNFVSDIQPDIIIFSGGNNISPQLYGEPIGSLTGISTLRDQNEMILMDNAMENNIKVLGICRGMQFVNVFLGGKLVDVKSVYGNAIEHVASSHRVHFVKTDEGLNVEEGSEITVNSFHDQGFKKEIIGKRLNILAQAQDGVIEMIQHAELPILGILWHPERPGSDVEFDKKLISSFINIENKQKINT